MEAARRTEMVDMEVNTKGEKKHSQEQPQYSRSAYRGLEIEAYSEANDESVNGEKLQQFSTSYQLGL